MLSLWKRTSVVLHFHHVSTKVYSPIMAPSTRIFNPSTRKYLKGCVLLKPRNTLTKRNTRFGQNTIHNLNLQRRISPLSLFKKSAKPQQAPSEHDQQQQDNPDPVFYREIDMSDLPSQYAEEVETFRHILDLPDTRKLCLGPLPLCWA